MTFIQQSPSPQTIPITKFSCTITSFSLPTWAGAVWRAVSVWFPCWPVISAVSSTASTDVTKVVLTAQFTPNTYTVRADANGGTINGKSSETIENKVNDTINSYTPVNGDMIFLGWKLYGADDTTASKSITPTGPSTYVAVWQEPKENEYKLTFKVDGKEYVVTGAIEGETISKYIPSDVIANDNLVVVEWDKNGEVTEDTVINAVSYYTTILEPAAQLGFDYTLEASSTIWF